MWIRSNDFDDNQPIPGDNAFCVIDPDSHVTFAPNLSPHLEWGDLPDGTRSLALLMIDVDVPTMPDDVNQEGREVPESLQRTDFTHWAIADVDAGSSGFERGAFSSGVTPRGKTGSTRQPKEGVNDYTSWFAGDNEMEGTYIGYDGPCPPWNDSLVHHYVFTLLALDVDTLDLPEGFTAADLRNEGAGHVLAEAQLTGTYTLNPRLA